MEAMAQGVAGRWPVFLERGCGPGVCKASLVSRVRDEVMACWAGGGSRDMGGQTQRVRVAGRPGWGSRCVWGPLCSPLSVDETSGGHAALAGQGGLFGLYPCSQARPSGGCLVVTWGKRCSGPGVDPRT